MAYFPVRDTAGTPCRHCGSVRSRKGVYLRTGRFTGAQYTVIACENVAACRTRRAKGAA